ncbi:TKL protein kinase [Salpingoeca rosetta]|uniref:TKL protein kinase n=1 Tax=Salpingoeca rosetta (strain ATCC 50818 / BSB-021) TaxID=946362 RepID=F2U3J0_SALR5|nr:TKL protein kinase [Salpingoeca rosetta]EGD82184.1 TKL protein kinase [Salpingoeca rosetta]|eukprot:XP_004996367.1 TKL protein kinase [Salpingoeca rosetta]
MPRNWNEFRSAHKGQGLSAAQMSSMYQAQKASAPPPASYSAPSFSYGAPSTPSSGNAWNAFRSAHKGHHLSPAQMSSMYQAEKAASSSSSVPASGSYKAPSTPSTPSTSSTPSSGNAWHEFRAAHKGHHLSPAQMSSMYQAEKAASSSAARLQQSTTSPASSSTPTKNPWHRFLAAHKGDGHSVTELSVMYRKERAQEQAASSTGLSAAVAGLKPPSSKPRKVNSWNEFQKEMKGSDMPLPDRLALYHALKRAQRGERDEDLRPRTPPQFDTCDQWADEYQRQTLERQQFAQEMEDSTLSADDLEHQAGQAQIPADRVTLRDKPIGTGAFGEVYAGTYDSTPVAVKVLSVEGKTRKKAFVREFATLNRLKHPNIIGVFGYVERDRSRMGIVMEFMSGGSLWDQLHGVEDGESLTVQHKNVATMQMISAIAFLHGNDIAHRDLKSRNFLVQRFNKDPQSVSVKLCDFGFVQLKNQVHSTTTSVQGGAIFVGTPSNAAPEVFAEEVTDDDLAAWCACDIYSFSVVLWELYEEEEPYFGKSAVTIKKYVLGGQRLPFEDTPEELRACIREFWQQDPHQRPTAADAKRQLSAFCG